MTTGGEPRESTRPGPPAPAGPAQGPGPRPAGGPEPEAERPGDPACLLRRVCPACGAVADTDPPTTCPACHAYMPAT